MALFHTVMMELRKQSEEQLSKKGVYEDSCSWDDQKGVLISPYIAKSIADYLFPYPPKEFDKVNEGETKMIRADVPEDFLKVIEDFQRRHKEQNPNERKPTKASILVYLAMLGANSINMILEREGE